MTARRGDVVDSNARSQKTVSRRKFQRGSDMVGSAVFRRRFVATAAVVSACLMAGCGRSEYDRRRGEWIERHRSGVQQRTEQAFLDRFYGASLLPGANVRLRVPQVFKTSFNADSKIAGENIDARRLQPPFLKLPGFKLSYESTPSSGQGGSPYYLYLAVVKGDALLSGPDALERQLRSGVLGSFTSGTDAWEDVTISTPSDETVEWRRLKAQGEQVFYVSGTDSEFTRLPGQFEIYLRHFDNQAVIIAWRAPETIVEASEIKRYALVCASTVEEAAP